MTIPESNLEEPEEIIGRVQGPSVPSRQQQLGSGDRYLMATLPLGRNIMGLVQVLEKRTRNHEVRNSCLEAIG
jgi:hypothetical protein